MHVAQIAPLWETIPPTGYGAIETLVGDLTEELISRGHRVTLFAAGDSKTSARLIPSAPGPLLGAGEIREPEVYRMLQLEEVRDRSHEFDLIHSHLHSNTGLFALPTLANIRTPVVHTIHCYPNPDNLRLLLRFSSERYTVISNYQRRQLSQLNVIGTVHHGLDVPRFTFCAASHESPYLAFLGRIRWEKGVHLAIEVARRAGLPLKIAGRVKLEDRGYFDEQIRPHLGHGVEFVGELGFDAKTSFLGNAFACLAPSLIPEPFGLVAIESGACGTPVLALSTGALPEVLVDGVTGFVRTGVVSLAQAVGDVPKLDRAECRESVATRFPLARMADGYVSLYWKVLCEA